MTTVTGPDAVEGGAVSRPIDEGPSPSRLGRILQLAVLGAPVVVVLVLGWTHRWMTEDGFIYLRIVEHLGEGNGPVFTEGVRAEAYTGTLWVGILTVADLLTPVRLEWLSVLLGLASTGAGVAFATVGARRLAPRLDRDRFWVPLGAVVFVAVFPTWAFATSGLETGLVFAWLGACLWVLARWADDPGGSLPTWAAVLIGLGWLVRPEMVLFSAAFLLLVVAGQRTEGRRAIVRPVVAAIALPVAYQLFRMAYFGSLVPNTAIAKEGTEGNWERGWRYLSDFVEPYWLWVALIGLVLGGYLPLLGRLRNRGRRRLGVIVAFVACATLNTIYVVAVGGDYHHGRMFLPALFALTAPVAAIPADRRHLAGLVVAGWAVVAMVALRPAQHEDGNWLANGFLAPHEFGKVTTDDYGYGDGSPKLDWVPEEGLVIEAKTKSYTTPDVTMHPDLEPRHAALWAVGISAYAAGSDLPVTDMMGLADPLASHMEPTPFVVPEGARYPGHEKPLPKPWLAALVTAPGTYPPAYAFPDFGNPVLADTRGLEFQEQVAWARAALVCDPIADLLRSSEGDLTLRRAVGNVVRSFEHTRMRIPVDPEEAYRRYCGDDVPPEVQAIRDL